MHEEQLRQNRPDLYRDLKRRGALEDHLKSVQRDAQSLYERVLADLKGQHPYNPVDWKNSREAWEGALERSAQEFVLHDRVLVPDEETEKAMRHGYTD